MSGRSAVASPPPPAGEGSGEGLSSQEGLLQQGEGLSSEVGPFMLPHVPAATKNERQKAIVRYEKYQIRCNLYKNQEKVSLR